MGGGPRIEGVPKRWRGVSKKGGTPKDGEGYLKLGGGQNRREVLRMQRGT